MHFELIQVYTCTIRRNHFLQHKWLLLYTFLRSVVCLSHSYTLLRKFDGLRYHLAATSLVASTPRTCQMDGVPDSPGKGKIWASNSQQKHAIANCCCHLSNRNEQRFRFFPNYSGHCCILHDSCNLSTHLFSSKFLLHPLYSSVYFISHFILLLYIAVLVACSHLFD